MRPLTLLGQMLGHDVSGDDALLNALKLDGNAPELFKQVEVRLEGSRVYVKAQGLVLDRAWQLQAIDYKAAFVGSSDEIICTATAIADVRDISKA